MSNFDLVFAYDDRAAAHFRSQGLPHPPVRPGNRLPTTDDIRWALGTLPQADFHRWPDGDVDGQSLSVRDVDQKHRISIGGFAWNVAASRPGDHFILRGRGPLAFALLVRLCDRCGQLVLWPDTGEAPVVVDAGTDPVEVDRLHRAAANEDRWDSLFARLYGRV